MAMAAPATIPPTICLLGATGKTGRVVLRLLLAKDLYNLKIYARSKARLVDIFPDITSNPRVQLYIGPVTDMSLMEKCLSGSRIIIFALGNNDFAPTTVLRESAYSIVAALNAFRLRGDTWQKPRMIYLSSASENKRFIEDRPKLVHWLIETAFQNGYDDLKAAQRTILADPSLVSVLLVQPGVLIEEEGTGCEISSESVKLACSYEDLGAAFVELALNGGYEKLNEVGVSSRLGDRAIRYAPIIFSRISMGLFVCYFPGGVAIREALQRVFPWIS